MPSAAPTLEYEAAAWAEAQLLVGVDEVGRGPLAGPVVAAAVVFPAGCTLIDGLRDSKTLPPARRVELAAEVRSTALRVGVGAASTREVDRLNVRVASALAMRRAIRRLLSAFDHPVRILIDGLPLPEIGYAHAALVEGDARCHSIAAAATVAKTVRDSLMQRLARRYPVYGWETNMGYGTPAHHEGLQRHGPCRHHRQTFGPVAQLGLPGLYDERGGDTASPT